MNAECFLDTNVLIYHLDTEDARKSAIAERLISSALVTGNGCISHQVVQECLNVALRKSRISLSTEQARLYLDTVLRPLWRVLPSPALVHRALDVQSRWRFSFYDSLIVAAALTAGCTRLYTEDLQHGQRIETLTITDPFRV